MGMTNSSLSSLVFTIVLLLLSSSSSTNPTPLKEVKVGGDNGWHVPPPNDTFFYIRWASNRRFKVGDSLRFEYDSNIDSVVVVDKWGYYHCNSTNPEYYSFKDGNTVVKLDKGGPVYFATGDSDHCKNGLRLQVNVMDHHHPSTPSSAPTPNNSAPTSLNNLSSPGLVLTAIIATIL